MGRKPKAKRQGAVNAEPQRTSPNWPLLAICIAGMALTAYLTYTSFAGAAVQGCSEGSGCDTVLNSRWSEMFGLPTALWGFVAYAGLAAIAFIKGAHKHWRYAWTAALLGVAYSVYLTTVSITVLKAACPYCLTSLGLMTAALVLTTMQRPVDLPRFAWQRWLTRRIPLAAAFVFALHLQYVVVPTVPVDPRAEALAAHLTKIGAKFYGASWCDHCAQQKRFFGEYADELPYIECSLGGPGSGSTQVCRDNYIKNYPTWVINDRRIEAVLPVSELVELSGFQQETAPPTP
jgi:uncharacterized membrane protein